jgi:hypothetical protein
MVIVAAAATVAMVVPTAAEAAPTVAERQQMRWQKIPRRHKCQISAVIWWQNQQFFCSVSL